MCNILMPSVVYAAMIFVALLILLGVFAAGVYEMLKLRERASASSYGTCSEKV